MACYAKTIIELASSQVGYHEENKNFNKYAKEIDSKYPTFYNSRKNGYDWCDIFVDWCFITSFGLENALRLTGQPELSLGASCTMSMNYYKKEHRFSKKPVLGSQIFFTRDQKSCYHTGIVVGIDDTFVYCVEGNSSNGVRYRSYAKNNALILGYGIPNYDDPSSMEGGNMKEEQEIAKEVIKGEWGTGEARRKALLAAGYNPTRIQDIVNAILNGTKLEKQVYKIDIKKSEYDQILINLV